MLALYRSGQQARALEDVTARAGTASRRSSVSSRAARCRSWSASILAHDPALGAPVPRGPAGGLASEAADRASRTATAIAVGRRRCRPGVQEQPEGGSAATYGLVELGRLHLRVGSRDSRRAAVARRRGSGRFGSQSPGRSTSRGCRPPPESVVDRIPVGGAPAAWRSAAARYGRQRFRRPRDEDRSRNRDRHSDGRARWRERVGTCCSAAVQLWVAVGRDGRLAARDRPGSGVVRRTVTLPSRRRRLPSPTRRYLGRGLRGGTVNEVDPRGGSILATVRVGTGPSATRSRWRERSGSPTPSTRHRLRIDCAHRLRVAATVPVDERPASVVAPRVAGVGRESVRRGRCPHRRTELLSIRTSP